MKIPSGTTGRAAVRPALISPFNSTLPAAIPPPAVLFKVVAEFTTLNQRFKYYFHTKPKKPICQAFFKNSLEALQHDYYRLFLIVHSHISKSEKSIVEST